MNQQPVAVIGAGWAGLTAALELARAGRKVLLFEAAAFPGGRARTLDVDGVRLDNGQHILLGACRGVLEQMRRVGVNPDEALLALPLGFTLREPGQRPFALSPRSMNSASLAWALFQALDDQPLRARIAALTGAARMLHRPLSFDLDVSSWLKMHHQPGTLIRRLWEPLCLAVMNTPGTTASARLFQHVLRLALRGTDQDARLLIPRRPLGDLFPEPAIDRLRSLGAEIRLGARISRLEARDDGGLVLILRGGATITVRQVVLATGLRAAQRLLPAHPALTPVHAALKTLKERAICTVYLRFAKPLADLPPLTGLLGQSGQWLFPRAISGAPHWVAVVISAAERREQGNWRTVARELAETFAELGLAEEGRAIWERMATIDARIGVDAWRLGADSGLPGLFLAGDHCATGLPSTLEGAVQSGVRAARALLTDGTDSAHIRKP